MVLKNSCVTQSQSEHAAQTLILRLPLGLTVQNGQ